MIVAVLRWITAAALGVCVAQLILFLSYYWHRIIPLRKEMPDVLAPPIRITFLYHLLVTGLFTSMVEARVEVLLRPDPPPATLATWVTPVMSLLMIYVLKKFTTGYVERLRSEQFKRS